MAQVIAYIVNKSIPFSTIPVNGLITKKDNKFFYNGQFVPGINTDLLKQYCLETWIHDNQFAINQEVCVIINNQTFLAKVSEFNRNNGKYYIKIANKPHLNCWIDEYRLSAPEKYFFLSSKGCIQDTYLDKDKDADTWRKKVGNFFKTKNECAEYRTMILNKGEWEEK